MTGPAKRRKVPRLLPLVLIGVAVAALAILVVTIASEGPDQTMTGTVTERESHRICVARPPRPDLCVRANSPEIISEISTGDCIRLHYSAEDVLISLDRVKRGCDDATPSK